MPLQFFFHFVQGEAHILKSGITHQVPKLIQCQCTAVRWIEQFFKVVVSVDFFRRRGGVGD